jgi:hypothetical protein
MADSASVVFIAKIAAAVGTMVIHVQTGQLAGRNSGRKTHIRWHERSAYKRLHDRARRRELARPDGEVFWERAGSCYVHAAARSHGLAAHSCARLHARTRASAQSCARMHTQRARHETTRV